jgi:hypothetical protein
MKQDLTKIDAAIVLKALEKDAAPLLKKLKGFEIASQDDYAKAVQLTKELKGLAKVAKSKQDEFVVPLNELIKKAKALFKPFTDMVEATELNIKVEMQSYLTTQAEKQKQLEQDVQSGKIKKVSTYVRKVEELEVKNSGVRKIWQAIEIDASKTPREYMVPDTTAIREALKAGKKVNGWEWKQVDSIAL